MNNFMPKFGDFSEIDEFLEGQKEWIKTKYKIWIVLHLLKVLNLQQKNLPQNVKPRQHHWRILSTFKCEIIQVALKFFLKNRPGRTFIQFIHLSNLSLKPTLQYHDHKIVVKKANYRKISSIKWKQVLNNVSANAVQ